VEIAPLGSGRHAHQIIAVVTKGPHTEGRWALTTALHRTPESGVCVLHPWDQPFLPAGADPHGRSSPVPRPAEAAGNDRRGPRALLQPGGRRRA